MHFSTNQLLLIYNYYKSFCGHPLAIACHSVLRCVCFVAPPPCCSLSTASNCIYPGLDCVQSWPGYCQDGTWIFSLTESGGKQCSVSCWSMTTYCLYRWLKQLNINLNYSPLGQNGHLFTDIISKSIFMNKNCVFLFKFHWSLFLGF